MVAGTATAVTVALANDRRLKPVFVEASSAPSPSVAAKGGAVVLPDPRGLIASRVFIATALAIAGILIAASIPAMTAFAASVLTTGESETAEMHGPPVTLRAASGVGAGWERAYAAAGVPVDDLAAAFIAGAVERQHQELVNALAQLYAEEQARQAAVARANASRSAGAPTSLGRASGYAAGTILSARITIYGCTGPGGGFCGNMATGIRVFEGAAACSYDLPFGTKIRIIGDPTGRTYECLDRGHLATTWVDVFFNDTSEGMRWQGLLGGTRAQIEIVN